MDFSKLIHAQMQRNAAVIEQACEMSLQQGTCGVFVFEKDDGTVEATVHPYVPYGNIYYGRISGEEYARRIDPGTTAQSPE